MAMQKGEWLGTDVKMMQEALTAFRPKQPRFPVQEDWESTIITVPDKEYLTHKV